MNQINGKRIEDSKIKIVFNESDVEIINDVVIYYKREKNINNGRFEYYLEILNIHDYFNIFQKRNSNILELVFDIIINFQNIEHKLNRCGFIDSNGCEMNVFNIS